MCENDVAYRKFYESYLVTPYLVLFLLRLLYENEAMINSKYHDIEELELDYPKTT